MQLFFKALFLVLLLPFNWASAQEGMKASKFDPMKTEYIEIPITFESEWAMCNFRSKWSAITSVSPHKWPKNPTLAEKQTRERYHAAAESQKRWDIFDQYDNTYAQICKNDEDKKDVDNKISFAYVISKRRYIDLMESMGKKDAAHALSVGKDDQAIEELSKMLTENLKDFGTEDKRRRPIKVDLGKIGKGQIKKVKGLTGSIKSIQERMNSTAEDDTFQKITEEEAKAQN